MSEVVWPKSVWLGGHGRGERDGFSAKSSAKFGDSRGSEGTGFRRISISY
jgi:hypothetical protein